MNKINCHRSLLNHLKLCGLCRAFWGPISHTENVHWSWQDLKLPQYCSFETVFFYLKIGTFLKGIWLNSSLTWSGSWTTCGWGWAPWGGWGLAGGRQGDICHLVSSVHCRPVKYQRVSCGKEDLVLTLMSLKYIWHLVSAVESSPSAKPPAKDLRAGGPGGDGGAGAIPGTWTICVLY